MLDFSAYLAAQHLTQEIVNDAPARPARVPMRQRAAAVARQRLSLALRRLADTIQPLPAPTGAPLPAFR